MRNTFPHRTLFSWCKGSRKKHLLSLLYLRFSKDVRREVTCPPSHKVRRSRKRTQTQAFGRPSNPSLHGDHVHPPATSSASLTRPLRGGFLHRTSEPVPTWPTFRREPPNLCNQKQPPGCEACGGQDRNLTKVPKKRTQRYENLAKAHCLLPRFPQSVKWA